MDSLPSLSQASFIAAIAASVTGTYIALSPPHVAETPLPSTADAFNGWKLTHKHTTKVVQAPLGVLALYTCALAWHHPNVPAALLGHGATNGLNPDLITWSPATAIPIALILCAGVPLRLAAHAGLGSNFTFALARPSGLTTSGLYHYVQHPGYTGMVTLVLASAALLYRVDGALACLLSPACFPVVRALAKAAIPVGTALVGYITWTRVRQEERMLRVAFGGEWEAWHARTARFLPGLV